MGHTPHELNEDFPGQADKIHALKLADARFAKLVEEYHEVNAVVHRAETKVEPMEQLAETTVRKQRGALKDEIARILARA